MGTLHVINKGVESAIFTTEETHLYVDFTSGNDNNDGRTSSTPIKTLSQLATMVNGRRFNHNTYVHCTGNCTETGTITLAPVISSGIVFILGGDEPSSWTELVAETVSDINTAATIGLTTAGWTTEDYAGKFVEITDGDPSAIGNIRMIYNNSNNTIVGIKNFDADPGVGAKFKIIEPSTKITKGASALYLVLSPEGNGELAMQNFKIEGAGAGILQIRPINTSCTISFGAIVDDSTHGSDNPVISALSCKQVVQAMFSLYNTSFAYKTDIYGGIGTQSRGFYASLCNRVAIYISMIGNDRATTSTCCEIKATDSIYFGYGVRFLGLTKLVGIQGNDGTSIDANIASYRQVGFNNGLQIKSSGKIIINGNCPFNSLSASSGYLELENSEVIAVNQLQGNAAPSVQPTYGCYMDVGSKLNVQTQPDANFVGSGANCGNKSAGTDTWANIFGGTPLVDATYHSVAF